MTYEEYIQNPMGGRTMVMSNREMYRIMYQDKWDKILLRENGKIDYALYKGKKTEDYFVYIKIPSEVVPKFYYDVVIRFYPPKEKAASISRTLNEYQVQFFSNDPSFIFTFAHAFSKKGLTIKDLEVRMGREAVKQRAESRNPNDQIGYVKSLYFAYLEIKRKGLFQKAVYDGCMQYDKQRLLSMITPANIKIDDRQREGAKIAKKERKEKSAEKRTSMTKETKTQEKPKGIRPIGFITSSISNHKKSAISKVSPISKIGKKR